MSIVVPSGAGDGTTDDAVALQAAFDAVSGTVGVVNLDGKTWRSNSALTLSGTVAVENGELLMSVTDTGDDETNWTVKAVKGSENYSRLYLRNVTIRKLQYANKHGLSIERGLHVRLDRVRLTNWVGTGTPLRVLGTQIATFTDVEANGCGTSALIVSGLSGFSHSTDLRFIGCTFANNAVEGEPLISMPAFGGSVGAAGVAFIGCSIQDAAGPLLEADNARYLTIGPGTRLEDPASGYSPIVLTTSNATGSNGKNHKIFASTFSVLDYGSPLVTVDDDTEIELGRDNYYPASATLTSRAGQQSRSVGAAYAKPTSGTHEAGDVVFNTDIKPGSPLGWVCIGPGSPGSWSPFGRNT